MSHILIIDDNPLQLRVRETIMRDAGFQVSIATTAESALALLKTQHRLFGAVITDHVLPKASGADFVRELRKANSEIPVIVVSGMAEAEDEYEGLGVEFRQKPLPPAELIDLVQTALSVADGQPGESSLT
ncbi:MAG TPA: response regulator [Clostridia bacterium]|nr:response regulator [Clostridia bacterium]